MDDRLFNLMDDALFFAVQDGVMTDSEADAIAQWVESRRVQEFVDSTL